MTNSQLTSPTLYELTREQLAELLGGEPKYRIDQVWDGLYTQLAAPADILEAEADRFRAFCRSLK